MIYRIHAELVDGAYLPDHTTITRTFRIGGSATLDDLAGLILDSVDFDRKYDYSFFVDSAFPGRGKEYHSSFSIGLGKTKEKLYSLGLKEGMNCVFLYGFGNKWIFVLTVKEVLQESGNIKAEVIESEGEVQQYPDHDEEFEDDYDEEEFGDDYDEEEFEDDYDEEDGDDSDDDPDGSDLDFDSVGHHSVKKGKAERGSSDIPDVFAYEIDFSDEYFDDDDAIITKDYNPRLGRKVLRVVEHQLETGKPAFVTDVYRALQKKGNYRKLAKVKIANALITVIFNMMKYNMAYSDQMYKNALQDIMNLKDPEDAVVNLETGMERKISLIVEKIDNHFMRGKEEKAAGMFSDNWHLLKNWIENNFAREEEDGLKVFSPAEIDEMTDYRIGLGDVIREIDQAFLNTGRYEQILTLFPEMLDFFSWTDGDDDTIRGAVGEAYERLQRPAEADAWFEKWYEEFPDHPACTNYYVMIFEERGDLEKARQVLEAHIPHKEEISEQHYDLYMRAEELYKRLGMEEKSAFYRDLSEKCMQASGSGMGIIADNLEDMLVAWKKPKVYPNDPCPCGSGKKYKKCCGRA